MILEAKEVSYAYRTMRDKKILDDVSVQFEPEKLYVLIGASGAGKTTFLSLLAGLDVPGSGEIRYAGEDIRRKGLNYHRRHNVSLVFQNYNLIDYLTPAENVALGGSREPDALLAEVAIPSTDWNRHVLELSGGQQQRVAIARALASPAKVLLADEPTGNLDEETASGIIALLKNSAREHGKCVIVSTHSRIITQAADEVLEIREGKISRQ